MDWIQWTDGWRVLVDFGLGLLIWLVQIIVYPSFLYASEDDFKRWHYSYTGRITWFVMPLMFSQLAAFAFLAAVAGRWDDWTGCGLIAICWVATFFLSVPCHDKMQREPKDLAVIRKLIWTNWIRTICWSLVFACDCLAGRWQVVAFSA
ncbi:MAG: hypothetical protein ACE361_16150 [Aureliella sp.]